MMQNTSLFKIVIDINFKRVYLWEVTNASLILVAHARVALSRGAHLTVESSRADDKSSERTRQRKGRGEGGGDDRKNNRRMVSWDGRDEDRRQLQRPRVRRVSDAN